MKKLGILLGILLFVSGCSVISIDDNSIDGIVSSVLSYESDLANQSLQGYKYYLPKGVRQITQTSTNTVLLDQKNYYYLYVDTVAYYHHTEEEYQERDDRYYSRSLDYNGNKGYLEINVVNNKYFIEMMYHYAKIEAYVTKEDLTVALTNICTILSSIRYNDSVLATLVGDNVLNYKEESFDIFKPKREEGNFLDYVEQFGTYQDIDNEIPDEDTIEIEEEIK